MSDKKAWLVTGAGRGLGVDIAHDDLLAVKLDVTDPADAASQLQRRLLR